MATHNGFRGFSTTLCLFFCSFLFNFDLFLNETFHGFKFSSLYLILICSFLVIVASAQCSQPQASFFPAMVKLATSAFPLA